MAIKRSYQQKDQSDGLSPAYNGGSVAIIPPTPAETYIFEGGENYIFEGGTDYELN